MLAEHHGSVIKLMAEEMARRCDAMAGVIRELADTEIAGMACAGSDAPVEDILGRMFRLVPPNVEVSGLRGCLRRSARLPG